MVKGVSDPTRGGDYLVVFFGVNTKSQLRTVQSLSHWPTDPPPPRGGGGDWFFGGLVLGLDPRGGIKNHQSALAPKEPDSFLHFFTFLVKFPFAVQSGRPSPPDWFSKKE